MRIQLAIKNLGPVPTFKNNKRIALNRKTGHQFLMTDLVTKDWMTKCIQSLESQLFCATRIGDGGTPTVPHQQSLIASSLPLDDSWAWCPEINIRAELVDEGNEGAIVTIERIT